MKSIIELIKLISMTNLFWTFDKIENMICCSVVSKANSSAARKNKDMCRIVKKTPSLDRRTMAYCPCVYVAGAIATRQGCNPINI